MKAFDRIRLGTVQDALVAAGAARCVVAGIVREWCSQILKFRWGGATSGPVRRSQGIPQGDPISPRVFNIVIWYLLSPVIQSLKGRRVGVFIKNSRQEVDYLNCLIYADDLVIMARSTEELQTALREVEGQLGRGGLALDPTKTEWSHNLAARLDGEAEYLESVAAVRWAALREKSAVNKAQRLSKKEIKDLEDQAQLLQMQRLTVQEAEAHATLIRVELEACRVELENLKARSKALMQESQQAEAPEFTPDVVIPAGNGNAKYVPPNSPLKIVGAQICGNGQTHEDCDDRVKRAWGAFWANKAFLPNKAIDQKCTCLVSRD